MIAEAVLMAGVLGAVALLVWWSPWSVAIVLVALGVRCASTAFKAAARPPHSSEMAFHAGTAAVAVCHLVTSLNPVLWDWTDWLISRRDFFFIWGYKAKLFYTFHGIPWSFLRSLPNDFTHPDYPLFVPLLYNIPAVLFGRWQPSAIAFLDTALGLALLGIVHRELRDELDPLFAAAGTFALSGSALLPWPGFAEGPLVAYGGAAVLLLRRGRSLPVAITCLAAAAMAKNEGMALAVAVAIALAVENRALLMKLWPVAVVIAAWLAIRHSIATDLFTGDILGRVGHNLAAFPRAFAHVPTYQPVVWVVSLIAVLSDLRRERFLLTITALQLLFYLAAYAITPHDVAGHVNGSWPRLTSHVTIFIAFAGVTSIGTMLKRR